MKKVQFLLLLCSMLLYVFWGCDNSEPNGGPENPANGEYSADILAYNYAIGTQTIGPSYGLTNETRLVETASRILEMGSNILKISLDPSSYGLNYNYTYSHQLLESESSFKKIMEMDFNYYFFWVYAPKVNVNWRDGLSASESADEYDNMYKLADYLLRNFNGKSKKFYLGHWEGDWHLIDNYNAEQQNVNAERIQGMIDWYNIRQKAIDDALAANTGSDVKVYHYIEVNRVLDAVNLNYDRVTNKVLPFSNVDYVSYSSYDATWNPANASAMRANLRGALSYIEQQLKPKGNIEGKRVFIGEYGYPARNHNEANQDAYSRLVMKYALEWGCPFVLYWEMYNNEVENGQQVGYWLIDNHGNKKKIYYTHRNFYEDMKKYVSDFKNEKGKLPSRDEFNAMAVSKL